MCGSLAIGAAAIAVAFASADVSLYASISSTVAAFFVCLGSFVPFGVEGIIAIYPSIQSYCRNHTTLTLLCGAGATFASMVIVAGCLLSEANPASGQSECLGFASTVTKLFVGIGIITAGSVWGSKRIHKFEDRGLRLLFALVAVVVSATMAVGAACKIVQNSKQCADIVWRFEVLSVGISGMLILLEIRDSDDVWLWANNVMRYLSDAGDQMDTGTGKLKNVSAVEAKLQNRIREMQSLLACKDGIISSQAEQISRLQQAGEAAQKEVNDLTRRLRMAVHEVDLVRQDAARSQSELIKLASHRKELEATLEMLHPRQEAATNSETCSGERAKENGNWIAAHSTSEPGHVDKQNSSGPETGSLTRKHNSSASQSKLEYHEEVLRETSHIPLVFPVQRQALWAAMKELDDEERRAQVDTDDADTNTDPVVVRSVETQASTQSEPPSLRPVAAGTGTAPHNVEVHMLLGATPPERTNTKVSGCRDEANSTTEAAEAPTAAFGRIHIQDEENTVLYFY